MIIGIRQKYKYARLWTEPCHVRRYVNEVFNSAKRIKYNSDMDFYNLQETLEINLVKT